MSLKKILKSIFSWLPNEGRALKDIYWKAKHFSRIMITRIRTYIGRYNIPHPDRIYWIDPNRIIYHTNYNPGGKDIPFRDRVFDPDKDKGKVIGGNWDISNYKFAEMNSYKAFEDRILKNAAWSDTEYYKQMLIDIDRGKSRWNCSNRDELNTRCEYLDSLIKSIQENGYKLSDEVQIENNKSYLYKMEEVTVNIGRNGEILFENGRHRLAIAKILKIPEIPVKIVVRHKEWQKFREYMINYSKEFGGELYQPTIHPDLSDIPYHHDCEGRFNAIMKSMNNLSGGKVLDIGAYIGYFCHKFEDMGFKCYAVELFHELSHIMRGIKKAENKNFEIIEKSIFEVEKIDTVKFDVVIALNIFHHFLKTEVEYNKLKQLLGRIKTDIMIFEPHLPNEPQMRNAFVNYNVEKFVNFILEYSSLNKSELIYTASDDRKVFKLYR